MKKKLLTIRTDGWFYVIYVGAKPQIAFPRTREGFHRASALLIECRTLLGVPK